MFKDLVGAVIMTVGLVVAWYIGFGIMIIGSIIILTKSFSFLNLVVCILKMSTSFIIIPLIMFISLYIGLKIQGRLQ